MATLKTWKSWRKIAKTRKYKDFLDKFNVKFAGIRNNKQSFSTFDVSGTFWLPEKHSDKSARIIRFNSDNRDFG